jgi:hypothetical protein
MRELRPREVVTYIRSHSQEGLVKIQSLVGLYTPCPGE